MHPMITIEKVTNKDQSVSRQYPDIYCPAELCSRGPCSVCPHSECILWWPSLNHQLYCTVIIRCTETFWSSCINSRSICFIHTISTSNTNARIQFIYSFLYFDEVTSWSRSWFLEAIDNVDIWQTSMRSRLRNLGCSVVRLRNCT
jgi:hypothetical protein